MNSHTKSRVAGALVGLALSGPALCAELDDVRAAVTKNFPAAADAEIAATPVEGLYQLGTGARVYYVFADGRHLLSGRLIDLVTRTDLTEAALGTQRAELMGKVLDSNTIVYPARGETAHTITVFTDIDCPYCRKLHQEMGELNDRGITVRYMLYPRAGVPSKSYDKAVSVWCAEDRNAAMDDAKAGRPTPKRDCDTPIAGHMSLAREVGLTGTPYTVTDTGRVVSGYMPAANLFESLQADKAPH